LRISSCERSKELNNLGPKRNRITREEGPGFEDAGVPAAAAFEFEEFLDFAEIGEVVDVESAAGFAELGEFYFAGGAEAEDLAGLHLSVTEVAGGEIFPEGTGVEAVAEGVEFVYDFLADEEEGLFWAAVKFGVSPGIALEAEGGEGGVEEFPFGDSSG